MEIWPNVQVISGSASNIYLCIEDEGLTLVDAGLPGDASRVFKRIDQLGYSSSDLKQILVTHADYDHVGGLAAIQEWSGARVLAGTKTAGHLSAGSWPKHLPGIIQWAAGRFFSYRPIAANCIKIIKNGEAVSLLGHAVALATPGHTPEHFSFYCPKSGILFAGDALHTRGGRIGRSPKPFTADQHGADMSAIKLMELAPALLACGHGRPLKNFDMGELMAFLNTLRTE